MRKLLHTVYVDGVGYGPDSEDIPSQVAARIGAHAWAADENGEVAENDRFDEGDGESGYDGPPITGKGSGIEEWRAYADRLDVPIDPDMKRDDIVRAVKTAGHPVE